MDLLTGILLFVLGVVYMLLAVSVCLRVNDRFKQCLHRACGDSEFLFYLVLVSWPVSVPVIAFFYTRPLKESDVMHSDW
ncbi:MAG: hypothetical protein OEY11_15230 [Gammaproteobacteria bacterium]|nr:hypothetical protein [Gammaproteobacteria bacterium]